MRKTAPHNPRGFERKSWNYRVLQLRHALGWRQKKLAAVMGVSVDVIERLERGVSLRPSLETIRRIRNLESAYADILKAYKKAPVRMDRLMPQQPGRVRLLPIEVQGPADIESMGEMEADSSPMFFGRNTRRKMQQTGMSMSRRAFLDRRTKAITRGIRKKMLTGWRPGKPSKKVQSGQSDDSDNGKG